MNATGASRVRALVLHPVTAGGPIRDPDLRLQEACGLAEALQLKVLDAAVTQVRDPRPATLFGHGKVEEIAALVAEHDVAVVVVDAAVTPVQQRNLEKAWNAKVLDRTGLILEIFGLRARTKEGVLQVELARLAYEKSRLVRTWTHLERQRGGRGFLAGPGETQIEADRRIIGDRMSKLRKELEDVRRTRGLHRAHRKRAPFPLIALVGYTNAGKSSLFNALTNSEVVAKDMLFATLDPTLRALRLPSGVRSMLSDTVGFISELPPDLVEAFQATLEEVREADLLVHVRDIANPETEAHKQDVDGILESIGAGEEAGQRMMEVWNKTDLLDEDERDIVRLRARNARVERGAICVPASVISGDGLDDVVAAFDAVVTEGSRLWRVALEPDEGKAHAWLHAHGDVVSERTDDAGVMRLEVRLGALAHGRFERSFRAMELVEDDRAPQAGA